MRKISKLEREWAADVLFSLVTKTPLRLKRGAMLREQMIEDLKNGKAPTGYRPHWIHTSAKRVNEELAKIAGEFNDKYAGDLASVDDLLDILATATHLLQKAKSTGSEESPKPPESYPS